MKGKIVSLNMSEKKGVAKRPVSQFELKEDWGVVGDVHAGPGDRQVSLLAIEAISRQEDCLKFGTGKTELEPGDFAENITTEGIDWTKVKVGDSIKVGEVELRLSKIGKECHDRCEIYKRVGDCIMPREGIFGAVVKGGVIHIGNEIEVTS
jgi:MOSC domain-containing protein YiiM